MKNVIYFEGGIKPKTIKSTLHIKKQKKKNLVNSVI